MKRSLNKSSFLNTGKVWDNFLKQNSTFIPLNRYWCKRRQGETAKLKITKVWAVPDCNYIEIWVIFVWEGVKRCRLGARLKQSGAKQRVRSGREVWSCLAFTKKESNLKICDWSRWNLSDSFSSVSFLRCRKQINDEKWSKKPFSSLKSLPFIQKLRTNWQKSNHFVAFQNEIYAVTLFKFRLLMDYIFWKPCSDPEKWPRKLWNMFIKSSVWRIALLGMLGVSLDTSKLNLCYLLLVVK